MTHTEKVHVIFGILTALTGCLALWHLYRPESRAGVVWPIFTLLIGLFLFIPVEAESRTYQAVGWSDVLLSAVPEHPATWVSDWLRYAGRRHVVQHKVGGLLLMAAGIVELLRARGSLAGPIGKLLFPTLLLSAALAFGIHGGTAAHLPTATEQRAHHIFGLALGAAAVTLGLARSGLLRGRIWQGMWAALVVGLGVMFAASYRLTPQERSLGAHRHASTGTRLR